MTCWKEIQKGRKALGLQLFSRSERRVIVFCVDYRRLNVGTMKYAYTLPRIDDSLDSRVGAKRFSTLDLCSGFWHVSMVRDDKPKTVFATKYGWYQFTVMSYGLYSVSATFERMIETLLNGMQQQICLVYRDDIIVMGSSFDNMLVNLKQVFDRLLAANLKLKPKKCHLFHKTVEFLGHVVSENGVTTDPSKLPAVKNWSV